MPIFDWLRRNRNRRDNANSTPAAPSSNSASNSSPNSTPAAGGYDEMRANVRPPANNAPMTPAADPEPEGPAGTQTIQMPEGTRYTVKAEDIQGTRESTLQHIAEQHGTIGWRLQQANEDVAEIVAGTQVYIPSVEEQLYADCVKKTQDHDKAATMFAEVSANGGLEVTRGARAAASGDSGESYGTGGKDGLFYASNPELAGASERRTVTEGGQKLYKINWLSNFWKCNLFANEAVYRAGYEPSMKANKHYTTAGGLHLDRKHYQEISASSAYAGCVCTLTSGTGSNSSHSGVLVSMPIISEDEDGNTVVEFQFLGASTDRAKEQDKKITLKKGTNEILSGDSHNNLRFLKPLKKR